jgi:hypothetical protein
VDFDKFFRDFLGCLLRYALAYAYGKGYNSRLYFLRLKDDRVTASKGLVNLYQGLPIRQMTKPQ